MSKRKSAAAAAVEFFQTAPIGTAEEILAICANTIKMRLRGETVPRPALRRATKTSEGPATPPAEAVR